MTRTSLVAWEPYQSPFAEFMSELLGNSVQPKSTMLGEAVWSEPSYTMIVSHGLWKIFEQVAETRKELLSTESRVAGIARIVDYLVNIGIMLVHKSPLRAATAFKEQVIATQLAQLRRGCNTLDVSMSDAWRLAAASFFAPLIKAAQEYGRDLVQQAELVQSKNLLRTNGALLDGGLPFVEEWPIGRIRELGALLSISVDLSRLDLELKYFVDVCSFLMKAKQTLNSAYATITLFQEFKFISRTFPADAFSTIVSIEDGLISTQILLAALGTENQNYLRAPMYAPAIQALALFSDKEMVSRTYKRIASQMPRLNTEKQKLLSDLIQTSLANMRLFEAELKPSYSSALFLVYQPGDFALNPEIALDNAAHGQVSVASSKAPVSAKKRALFKKQLARSINWQKLTMQEFCEILERESLQPVDLVDGIAGMSRELQTGAIATFLASEQCNQESMTRLIKRCLIIPDAAFILEYVQYMPQHILKETFESELMSAKDITKLLALAIHMMPEIAKTIFKKETTRIQLIEVVSDLINDGQVNKKDRAALKHILGAELWTHLVLAADVQMRETEYRHPPNAKNRHSVVVPWAEAWEIGKAHGLFSLPTILELQPTEMKALLEKHSETSMFLWLHAGSRTHADLITVYTRARSRYYRLTKK